MRKWTYLVAALLMSGATATFTSCIDTEEPAGITDLRGAKADFIRAKAAYQDAVTQLELVKVQREEIYRQMEEIDLQMKQIDLELKQAQADYLIEEWTQKKEYLVEQYKAWMAEAQAKTAWAQATLIRALADLEVAELTARDDAFAAEILQTRGALNTALTELTVAQGDLYTAEMSQLAYVSRNQNYVHSRELLIAEQQYDLNILNSLLDSYKNITNPNDLAELNKKKAEINNKIATLDQKEYDAVMALEEKRNGGAFADASREMEGVLNVLKKDTAFVLPVAQVDASIQADFYTVLTTNYSSATTDINRIFNADYSEMIADFELNATILGFNEIQLQNLKTHVVSLANNVIVAGKAGYVNAYNSLFGSGSLFVNSAFENDNQVKSSLAAKVKTEQQRLSVDAKNINANYKKILKEWVDNYVAYQNALIAYGYAGGSNATDAEYEKVSAAIKTFKDLRDATTPPTADQLKAGAKTLRSAIQAYAALRNPVDGMAEPYLKSLNTTYGITSASGTAVDPLDTDANVTNFANNYIGSNSDATIVGSKNLLGDYMSLSLLQGYAEDGVSTLHKFMLASYKLFGLAEQFEYRSSGYYTSITDIYVPVLADVTKAPADEAGYEATIPTDFETNRNVQGVYRENLAAQDFDGQYPGLANYDKWLALYNYIDGQADLINDRVLALNDVKDAVIAKYDDAYMDLWKAELEAYLIKGNDNVTYNSQSYTIVSTDNPYHDYLTNVSSDLTNNGVSYSELTELTVLNRQLNTIQDAIDNGEFYYVTYNEVTDKYEVTNGQKALETLIEETQTKIAGIEYQIAQYEDEIKWFEEYGWDGVMTSEYYENWVAEKKQIVANKQADVDYYTAALQKLLDAFAAE